MLWQKKPLTAQCLPNNRIKEITVITKNNKKHQSTDTGLRCDLNVSESIL